MMQMNNAMMNMIIDKIIEIIVSPELTLDCDVILGWIVDTNTLLVVSDGFNDVLVGSKRIEAVPPELIVDCGVILCCIDTDTLVVSECFSDVRVGSIESPGSDDSGDVVGSGYGTHMRYSTKS